MVPRLSKRKLQPGVNGVTQGRDGRWNIGDMKAHAEKNGWRLIDLSKAPNGKSYLKPIKTRPGGRPNVRTAYVSVFENAYPGSPHLQGNTADYVAWLELLIEDGTILPCPPFIAQRIADKKRSVAENLAEKVAQGNTRYKTQLNQVEAEIAALMALAAPQDAAPVEAADDDLEFNLDGEL